MWVDIELMSAAIGDGVRPLLGQRADSVLERLCAAWLPRVGGRRALRLLTQPVDLSRQTVGFLRVALGPQRLDFARHGLGSRARLTCGLFLGAGRRE